MAGTTLIPSPAVGSLAGINVGVGGPLSASFMNKFRINTVVNKLATLVQPGSSSDAMEFFNLCLSLARGIDYAVANNEVPTKAQDLPLLLKQVCQRKNDLLLQSAIMVLMISVKNACKIGWFSEKETEELFTLAHEIGSSFCSPGDISAGPSYSLSTIKNITERFYPRMKMGQILASLEVKPGYGAYVIDFHISKNTAHSPEEKIWLFVAQTDNIDTSACIINPPQVNFLLNGRAVERRTNVQMDTGPQIPTNVTAILKYGTNLLQAVGQFNGHHIIVVAFMSVTSSPNTSVLLDYVQPSVSAVDSDSDIIEGPSRISLNCPISYTRIKIPVKGRSCKHLQCFDFSNFVDINSRRPSWRCPHCNQNVCYLEIRVDQNMFKVLREVGENVSEVIISADGSWKAVMESDDHLDQAQDKTLNSQKERTGQLESTSISNSLPTILDLTEDYDEMEVVSSIEIEDRKPLQVNLPVATNLTTLPPELNNTNGFNQNVAARVEDDFWSGLYFAYGPMTSSARSNAQTVGSEPIHANSMQSPVLTDAISPAPNRVAESHVNTNCTTSVMQQCSTPNNFQLQQSQYVNSFVNNEYGRVPSIPRHVSRTPIAVQALPAQSQAPNAQQRPRSSMNSLTPNGSSISQVALSMPPSADAHTIYSDKERQQHFRAHLNSLQVPDIPSSSLQHSPATQNRDHQARSFIPGQSVQQVGHPARSQLPSAYRAPPGLSEFQNSHLQQTFNPRMSRPIGQSPSMIRPSSHLPRTQIHKGGPPVGIGNAAGSSSYQHPGYVAAQRPGPMIRTPPSVPVFNQTLRTGHSLPVNAEGFRASAGELRGNLGGMSPAGPSAEGLVDSTTEQDWRPTGRMRGSLSGRAYSAALSQFMIQPTQTAQTPRPPPNLTPAPSVPPQLQVLIANSRNGHGPPTQNIQ